jgi:dienelactone hydrolase
VAFYPTDAPTHPTTFGPFVVDASDNIRYSSSPTAAAARWENHDFLRALAQHGYIVATVEHSGDNFADNSGLGTDGVLIGRERQMSALIDAVLADPALAAHIDPARIGAAGFSAGGYTALLLAGAVPRFDLLASGPGGRSRSSTRSSRPSASHASRRSS